MCPFVIDDMVAVGRLMLSLVLAVAPDLAGGAEAHADVTPNGTEAGGSISGVQTLVRSSPTLGVRRGEAVAATSRQGSVVVQVPALAMQSAALGHPVVIRLSGARSSLLAWVTAPGRVEMPMGSRP